MNPETNKSEKLPFFNLTRRDFLQVVSVGLGGLAAVLVSIPVIGALISPLLNQPPEAWRAVGKVDNFNVNETVEVTFQDASPMPWAGVSAKTAAWLRRVSQDLQVVLPQLV